LQILYLQEKPKADSVRLLESKSIIHNRSYPYFFMSGVVPQTAEIIFYSLCLCTNRIFKGGSVK
jgi:hypothetical protein